MIIKNLTTIQKKKNSSANSKMIFLVKKKWKGHWILLKNSIEKNGRKTNATIFKK